MSTHQNHRLLMSVSLAAMAAFGCVLSLASDVFAQSSAPPQRPKRYDSPEQYYQPAHGPAGKTVVIPMGTVFEGRIDTTISSAHSHSGQRFNIVMASPVLMNGTDVIIPAGSSVIGEVVEAVPASQVPKAYPGQDKRLIKGKLRVQVAGLKTPDGVTYPLVASIAGEIDKRAAGRDRYAMPYGTGVAYVGSTSSFEGVNHNRDAYEKDPYTGRIKPKLVTKKDFMKDQIFGNGDEGFARPEDKYVRALTLNKRDYFIYDGASLSVRLNAPFRIGITPTGMGASMGEVVDENASQSLPPPSNNNTGGRFSRGAGEGGAEGGGNPGGGQPPVQATQTQPQQQPPQNSIPADSF